MKYTIKKKFEGYPFAHRQPSHNGHCALVHGHNWSFEIEMSAEELDENDFVYDFGKFGWLKTWLADNFDHTLVLNEDDPDRKLFEVLKKMGLAKVVYVPSCSAEGLAKYVYDYISYVIINRQRDQELSVIVGEKDTDRGIQLESVTVYEDHKNKATYNG